MIYVVNRALGLLNGGAENFDIGMIKNVFDNKQGVDIYCGDTENVKNYFNGQHIQNISSPSLPFIRKLAYKVNKYTKLSAFLYTLDNLLFELAFIKHFILNRKKNNDTDIDIIYCCSLFFIPLLLCKFYPKDKFFSWLPGPPGRLVKILIRILVKNNNFELFTRGFPELVLDEMGLKKNEHYFVLRPSLSSQFIDKNFKRNGHDLKLVKGITVARLVPIKNIEFLIECLSHCKKDTIDFEWIIVGDGPEREKLDKLVRKLSLETSIFLVGELEHVDVINYLETSNVFALSSEFENYSNAVLEGFAFGLPCLLTDVGYMKQLAGENKRGYIYNSTDEFKTKLIDIFKNKKEYNEMSMRCTDFAKQHTWENNYRTFWGRFK
jgi:glycosyltransferase involved in cell wall biosynthesis